MGKEIVGCGTTFTFFHYNLSSREGWRKGLCKRIREKEETLSNVNSKNIIQAKF